MWALVYRSEPFWIACRTPLQQFSTCISTGSFRKNFFFQSEKLFRYKRRRKIPVFILPDRYLASGQSTS
jgi:hypothetical protein